MTNEFEYRQNTDASLWLALLFFMGAFFFGHKLFDPNFIFEYKGLSFSKETSRYIFLGSFGFCFLLGLIGVFSFVFEKRNKDFLLIIDDTKVRIPPTLFAKEKIIKFRDINGLRLKQVKPNWFLEMKTKDSKINLISSYFEAPEKFEKTKMLIAMKTGLLK